MSREETKKIGTEKNNKNDQKNINKITVRTYILIITLDVNGPNAPIKRHRVVKWIKKKKKMLLYIDYKRLTTDLKTYID